MTDDMGTVTINDHMVESWLRWPIRAELPSMLAIGLAGFVGSTAPVVSVAAGVILIACIAIVNVRILVRPGEPVRRPTMRSQPMLVVALNVWAWTGRIPRPELTGER